jgi:hypothetical protein
LALLALIAASAVYFFWPNPTRSRAIETLSVFDRALSAADGAKLDSLIQLPSSVAAKTPEDKARWIADVLSDEVSADGVAELRHHAVFGSLLQIFPAEAERWAEAAKLPVSECVAFRLERAGIRAEVVLHQTPAGFRVLRCNNVKQMALPAPVKT